MAGEWADTKLEDVSDDITVGFVGSMSSLFIEQGVPLLRGQNIQPGRLDLTNLKYISTATHQKWKKSALKAGDVVIVRVGYPGTSCVIPDGMGDLNAASLVIVRPSKDKLDSHFLCYVLNSQLGQQLIRGRLVGSVQQVFNTGTAASLEVLLPPLAEQKAIAAVLGALDDKIELNRRMNATLEAMARALFQSWFVDFDPVRAKLDGRPPAALDPATAALFPAAFQDSEAGHIPKGWTVGKVSDLAMLNRGAVNPGDFPAETFDHFSLPAFDNGRTPKMELGSAIMSNKFTVTPNSVLLSKLNPHIPRIWLPDLHASRRSVCSTEFMVACSKPGVSREYLFSLFTSSAFASIYGTLVTGTTGSHQRIRPESVLDMKIVIPSPPLIRAFTDVAKPMFDHINRNTEQSRTLATLRDTLLPKLLSGELSVADGKQIAHHQKTA